MSCNIKAPTTGLDSELGKSLEKAFPGRDAKFIDTHYNYFKSDYFKSMFGDWEADYRASDENKTIPSDRLDDNGEPKLFYDENHKRHYFINKYNEPVYYPISLEGKQISRTLNSNEIDSVLNTMALEYITPIIGEGFAEINIDTMLKNLPIFIEEFLDREADRLINDMPDLDKASDDEFYRYAYRSTLGNALIQSKDYIDEWTNLVSTFFARKRLQIIHNEGELNEIEHSEQTRSEQAFGKSSFERSARSNVTSDIKLGLMTLRDPSRMDPILNKPIFVDFSEVYGTLIGELNNIVAKDGEDLYDLYIEQLNKTRTRKPYLGELIDRLEKSSESMKSRFVQAINVGENTFMSFRYERDKDDLPVFTQLDLTSEANKVSMVRRIWDANLLMKINPNNTPIKTNSTTLKKFKEGISNLNKRSKYLESSDDSIRDNIVNYLQDFLENIGIPLNRYVDIYGNIVSDVFNYYIDGNQPEVQSREFQNIRMFNLISALNYMSNLVLNANYLNKGGEIFSTQSAFRELAEAEVFFTGNDLDSSIHTSKGSRYLYSNRSHISKEIQNFKDNPYLLLQRADEGAFYKGSRIINTLRNVMNPYRLEGVTDAEYDAMRFKEGKEYLNSLNVEIFESMYLGNDSSMFTDSKDIVHIDTTVSSINNALMFNIKGKRSRFSTPTPADKGTMAMLQLPPSILGRASARIDTNTNQLLIGEEATDIIYQYVIDEFNRIKEATKEIELATKSEDYSNLSPHYHLTKVDGEWVPVNGNALRFTILPEMNNPELVDFLYKDGKINTDLELLMYGTEEFNYNLEEQSPTSFKLRKYIDNTVKSLIQETYDRLNDNNIFDHVDKNIQDHYRLNYFRGHEDNYKWGIAGDYIINGLIAQIEYSKLFTGDYAYFKNMDDYKKRVPMTYTDGLYLRLLESDNPMYKAAYIDNVDIGAWDVNKLSELVGEGIAQFYRSRAESSGSGIDSTDAQAWITPDRWKFILDRAGKWTDAHNLVYDKITGTNKEPLTIEESMIAAQPIKGVYYALNNGRPVFHKFSQAVLTQQLVDSADGLNRIRDAMYEQGVDEVITMSGVKVGAVMPTTIHTSTGDVLNEVKFNPIQLPNSGYKIQQDLSPKGFKPTDVGSQSQQMVFTALFNTPDSIYNVVGKGEMTGKELSSYIHDIAGKMSDKGSESFLNSMGLNKDLGTIDRERMFKSVRESLLERENTPENLLEAIESNINPYALPGFSDLVQQTVASRVLKSAVKIKTNGGSFIQMADFGISKKDGDSMGIVWTPWADDKLNMPRYATDASGDRIFNTYKVDGKEVKVPVIKPGGVLIPASFITKLLPNWRDYNPTELFGTSENNYTVGIIDKEILQNLVGYRIPTQGLASMDALYVAGILPDGVADTVVAYTGITTKTGSDFDIDKMYMMMPSIRLSHGNKESTRDILWNSVKGKRISDTIDNIEQLLEYIDEGYELSKDPEVIEKVLSDPTRVDELKLLMNTLVDLVINSDSDGAKDIKDAVLKAKGPLRLEYKNDLASQLVQSYHSILSHPDNMKEIMTPIDMDFMKNDIIGLVPSKPDTNFKDFNPLDEIDLRIELMVGTKGVGAAANAGKDHIRGLFSDGRYIINDVPLDSPYSMELSDKDMLYYSKDTGIPFDQVKELQSIKTADTLSAVLNAFVDIANDNYITRANWNPKTFGVGFFMLRSGIHPFHVNAFLSNPIIKEYVDFMNYNESLVINDNRNLYSRFLERLVERSWDGKEFTLSDGKSILYSDVFKVLGINRRLKSNSLNSFIGRPLTSSELKDLNTVYFTDLVNMGFTSKNIKAVLIDSQLTDESGAPLLYSYTNSSSPLGNLEAMRNYVKEGLPVNLFNNSELFKVLDKFRKYQGNAKNMSLVVRAAKPDTYAYGQDLLDLQININTIAEALTNPLIEGFENRLLFENRPTYLAHMINNSIIKPLRLYQDAPADFIEVHPTVLNTFNEISYRIKGTTLQDRALGERIKNHYYAHIMSGFGPYEMDNSTRYRLINQMPNKVRELQRSELKDNAFVKALGVTKGDSGVEYVGIPNKEYSKEKVDSITNGWKEMFRTHPEISSDLVRYSYIVSGFQNNINNFFKFIPYEFTRLNDINRYMNELAGKLETMDIDEGFINDFFAHNIKDNAFTREIKPFNMKKLGKYDVNTVFTVDPKFKDFILGDKTYFRVNVENPFDGEILTKYYRYAGEYPKKSGGSYPIFRRVHPLGHTDKRGARIFEYNINNENNVSGLNVNKTFDPHAENYARNIEPMLKDIDRSDNAFGFNNSVIIENAILERVVNRESDVSLEDLNVKDIDRNDLKC